MAELIKGFKHHTITREGVVTNLKTGNAKTIWIGASGYYNVDIQEFGVPKKASLHRLLAIQFIPNPLHKEEVNHIDGDKTNYSLDNLEWVTHSENMLHAYKTGLH